MERSPLVRLLMSQERVNTLGRLLEAEPVGKDFVAIRTSEPVSGWDGLCSQARGRVAQLQEDMDREARASLIISWLGMDDSPTNWG